jgi:stage V sporulation protein B
MPITAVRFSGSLSQPLISMIVPLRLVKAGYTQGQAVASLGVSMGMVFPLIFLPGTIVGSLAMALVPDLSGSLARGETENVHKRIRSSIIFTIVVAAAFVPLFVAVGRQIGIVLFNNTESGILLAQGAIVMIPLSLSNITSTILNSLGLEVKSMRNYLIGSVFLFLAVWFLPAHVGGGLALLIGMGVCTLIASVLNIIMLEKKLGKKTKYIKEGITLIIFAFICGFTGRFVFTLANRIMPMFTSALLGGSLSLFLFYFLLCAFKFITPKYLSSILKRQKIAKAKSLLF